MSSMTFQTNVPLENAEQGWPFERKPEALRLSFADKLSDRGNQLLNNIHLRPPYLFMVKYNADWTMQLNLIKLIKGCFILHHHCGK